MSESDRYLLVVEYDQQAERKRVEYLFDNWDGGTIENHSGIVRIAEGVDHDALYEQLVTKVPADQVESYRLESVDPNVSEQTVTVEQEIPAPSEAVESFVEYALSKKKAVLQSATRNEYEIYTKKGRAEVSYRLSTDGDATTVRVQVSGYPPAPEFLADFFETELADYADSQR